MKPRRDGPELVRIRPRPNLAYISRGRSVLATTSGGLVDGGADEGFFVHETRLLSRWRYTIDGDPPAPNAFSAVRQNRWCGYFALAAPGVPLPEEDTGSGQVPAASQNTLELQVTRVVDDGLHEDLDLTNYTMEPTSFAFAIELDADLADPAETRGRVQQGTRETRRGPTLLAFDYTAEHGGVTLRRSVEVEVAHASTSPRFEEGRIRFDVSLATKERWHACVRVSAVVEGERFDAPSDCYGARAPHDETVGAYLEETTQFEAPGTNGLTADVVATLEQARADLAALRLFDLDGDGGWTLAAGLPLYIALFGRETFGPPRFFRGLTASSADAHRTFESVMNVEPMFTGAR